MAKESQQSRRSGARSQNPARGSERLAGGTSWPLLEATVRSLAWRMDQAATRMREADAALERGDSSAAYQRLLDLEPLVYEAGRILSAGFILIPENEPVRMED